MSDVQALFDAIRGGDLPAVQQLLTKDSSLAAARNPGGVSALSWSVYVSQPEIRDLLLSKLPQVDLFEAAMVGRKSEVERILAARPAAVNEYSTDGFTALGLAAFFGQYEVAELLLERGANPNLASKNSQRVAPLHSAVAQRDPDKALRMATLLLEHQADVNAAQHSGWTPLHQASAHGNDSLVAILLQRGANPAAAADDGMTAQDFAKKGEHHSTIQILVGVRAQAPAQG
jgi:ankyrin repeat protein